MTPAHDTPLLTALAIAAARDHAAFYAPGHKQGQGASDRLRHLIGAEALRADLPELPELDNLFAPTGPIDQAQRLAAHTFGADDTFFLANGSTCGIEAAVMTVCGPGQKILVPRNAHKSVLAALVLSGAQPIYLAPLHSPQWDLAFGVTAEQVQQALAEHPDIVAVLVVSPSYHGVCADLAAIAHCVHRQDKILIVDEAHGAHLGFHPQLPSGAIAAGADVVIQSTHKLLAAMTQASMLHIQGERVPRDRLRQALQLTQSTSPNYLLLASLDAARHQMAVAGQDLMAHTLAIAEYLRRQLTTIQGLTVLTSADLQPVSPSFQLDPTRLVIDVSALGLTGFTADEFLHEQQAVTAELPTLRQLAFIVSLGNCPADGDRLIAACQALIRQFSYRPQTSPPPLPSLAASTPAIAHPPMTPRQAFFAPAHPVPITEAIGQLSADTLCPYPPGIPVLLPGEVITEAAIATLLAIHQAGGVITGTPEGDWHTLQVVSSSGSKQPNH